MYLACKGGKSGRDPGSLRDTSPFSSPSTGRRPAARGAEKQSGIFPQQPCAMEKRRDLD